LNYPVNAAILYCYGNNKSRPRAYYDAIWEIFCAVVKPGDTYAFAPDSIRSDMMNYWLGAGMETFIAIDNNQVAGTYFLKPNQVGLGNHIGNCGYMVHPGFREKGVGSLYYASTL
jgi:hypothetical protein